MRPDSVEVSAWGVAGLGAGVVRQGAAGPTQGRGGGDIHQEEWVGEHEGVQEVGGGLSEVYKMEYPLDIRHEYDLK